MTPDAPAQAMTQTKATGREWTGLAVLALPCLLYSMDLTVLNLAVPHLTADLKPSASQLLWIVDIYGFLLAGALMTMGTLGDRIGRRKLLLIGASVFGAASILAAFAPTANLLVASRALLGLAAATLAPSTLSLIRNMFLDARERTFAIGVWAASFSAGAALGPLIGGVLLERFWWGSVFLIAVPVMALLLFLGPRLLPEFRDPDAGRMDIPSAAMSLTAVLAVIYGIKRIAEIGSVTAEEIGVIVFGLVVGAWFVRRQRRLADPLIDLKMFRIPALGISMAINIIALFIAFALFLFIAQYFQLVLGMRPLEAGLWSAPSGIAFAAGSMLTPAIAHRVRAGYVLAGGFFVSALGMGIFALAVSQGGDMALFMVGYVLFCFGLSPIGTLTTDIVVGLAPPERAGAASALSETSFEFGGALGIAVMGSVVTAMYRQVMIESIPPDLPADAARAAIDTLGGAVAAAQALPAAQGDALATVARDAFTQAFISSTILCVGIAIVVALLTVLFLRSPQSPGG
jgi:DHA2 family multidrug resistance protein-like MFS transporter